MQSIDELWIPNVYILISIIVHRIDMYCIIWRYWLLKLLVVHSVHVFMRAHLSLFDEPALHAGL